MEIQQLQEQLKVQLEQNHKGTVIHSDIWCIPVHSYQITYQPVQKKSMDILMKILLISFQKSSFESAEQLSEILLVESLFVEDLIRKMQKNGLLTKELDGYQLTEKGKSQFSRGVFEEELEPVTTEMHYSPVHEKMLDGDIEEVLDFDDFPDQMYRYIPEEKEVSEAFVIEEIRAMQLNEDEEQSSLIEIKSILSMEHSQTNDLPCIEFVLFKEENKELLIKVWNTLYNNWDSQLEKELMQKEKGDWLSKKQP